jgi:hypothetical protein
MVADMTQPLTDPGPVPELTDADRAFTERLNVIATIHAMAEWLTQHPDVPTPHTVSMRARAGHIKDTDDAERVAVVDLFHAAHGGERYHLGGLESIGGRRHEYARLPLGNRGEHGATFEYTVSTTRMEEHG